MTATKPCRHCQRRTNCPSRLDKLKAVRGLGLTLINFRCDVEFEDFRPGDRVSAELDSYNLHHDGVDIDRKRISGTVLRWQEVKRKVLVQFDEGALSAKDQSDLTIIGMWPDRLTPLDEPIRELCECGFVTAGGACVIPEGFRCLSGNEHGYHGAADAVAENEERMALTVPGAQVRP